MWRCLAVAVAACGCSGAAGSTTCTATSPAGTVCELAGTGQLAFNGDGKAAEQTALYLPSQVRRGPDGLLYIMDFNNQRLRRISADGTIATIAGNGFHLGATVGIPATDSSLENPIDFDFLPDGRIVFVSYHDPRVLMIDSDGTLEALAGTGELGARGNEGDGGPATQAQFISLAGVAVAPDGTIFVADDMAMRVRVIRAGIIDTLAGTGEFGYRGDGGPGTLAAMNEPNTLALDAAGNLYVSEASNCVVRKIAPDGTISTVAGIGMEGRTGDGGPATAAALGGPDGIAVAPDGTLYIGDRLNFGVRSVTPDGTITAIAGTGTRGWSGDGGPALDAQFGYVARVQLDRDGGLLVADQTNATIRKLVAPL